MIRSWLELEKKWEEEKRDDGRLFTRSRQYPIGEWLQWIGTLIGPLAKVVVFCFVGHLGFQQGLPQQAILVGVLYLIMAIPLRDRQ